jgi:hypothetical protein
MVFRRHLHFNPYLLPSFPSWVRCFSPQKRSLLQFGELHGRNTRSFSALGLEAWFAPGWKRKMVAMLGGKCRLAKVFGFKWSTVTPSTFLYFSHQIKGECDISSVLSLHAILSQDFSNVWAANVQFQRPTTYCFRSRCWCRDLMRFGFGTQMSWRIQGAIQVWWVWCRYIFDPHSPFQHETVDLIGISADFQLPGFPAGTFAHLCCRVLTPVLPSNMVHR